MRYDVIGGGGTSFVAQMPHHASTTTQHPHAPHRNGLFNDGRVLVPKEPRFPALGLQMGMPPEKGMQGTQLVPPNHEFCIRVAKKPTHIGTRKRVAGDGTRQHHRDGHPQMVPIGGVVPCPQGPHRLGPREKGTGEHKRAVAIRAHAGAGAFEQALCSGSVVVQPIGVVDVTVFGVIVVLAVLVHRNLMRNRVDNSVCG